MAHADAATTRPPVALPEGFRASTVRGTEGFFRAGQDGAGRWWLIDADGRPVFGRAVHGVRAGAAPVDETVSGRAATAGPYAPEEHVAARLRRWGFNAVGVGGDGVAREDGFAFMASVDFCRAGALISGPGVRLPDVFDPDWRQLAMLRAHEVCEPLAENRALIGWLADDLPGWGPAEPLAPERPGLLQVCLSLEPSFAAYHAAWEFVLALHGGRFEAVGRAWGVELNNKETVRGWTRTEHAIGTRGHRRDDARWSREYARRYFTGAAAAIRAADPHHLVLGARFGGPVGEAIRAECVYPAVDVALLDWTELPALSATATGPVLAGDFCWADTAFREAPAPKGGLRRLTTVERMLRRGRAALERAARHPAVAGYVWRQWLDDPGEQAPFARGLVHNNGTEAREHTELLTAFNLRAEALRRAPVRNPTSS
jgi:agarase